MSFIEMQNLLTTIPRFYKRLIVFFCDSFICVFSLWLAFGLRLEMWGPFQPDQLKVFILSIGLTLPLFLIFGLYKQIFRYIGLIALKTIIYVFIIYSFLFFIIIATIRSDSVPLAIGIIQPILFFLGVGASRYLIYIWLGANNNLKKIPKNTKHRVLIYGAGSAGRELASSLLFNNSIQMMGFVDDDKYLQGSAINNATIYGSAEIKRILISLKITDIFLAIPSVDKTRRKEIISNLEGCGVRIRTLPEFYGSPYRQVNISDLRDLDMNDLLGRDVVSPKIDLLEKNIRKKIVLVTGAGGSIGSELCRQIIKFSPSSLILIDISEYALYKIYEELKVILALQANGRQVEKVGENSHIMPTTIPQTKIISCLASVRDVKLMRQIFMTYQPYTVFHAAAYKHVPLVEKNPVEGIRNNVFGALTCAQIALDSNVQNFTLISSDKAVRPTNVMGASKRMAELVLQSLADFAVKSDRITKFSMVRFGNVLGSSGSVTNLFREQIKAGGPITLTHHDVSRYFMTIPEAAQLVIQSSAMAIGGDVFLLDMGKPIRIYDLAVKMIYLSGFIVKDASHPSGDIEIQITGLRSGEKLHEELLIGDTSLPTDHPKIMRACEEYISWTEMQTELEKLSLSLQASDAQLIWSSIW
jgi:FlaA1/EpsC-like NDP-sugar epimerase